MNSINPGMVETEGLHAAGIAESDFRKQIEAQRRSAASASRRTSPPPPSSSPRLIRLDHRRNADHLRRPALSKTPTRNLPPD